MSSVFPRVRSALAMQRAGWLIGAVVALVAGLGLWLPLEVDTLRARINVEAPPGGVLWGLRVVGIGSIVVAALLTVKFFRIPASSRHPLYTMLTEHPQDVVWVHANMAISHRVQGVEVNRTRNVFFMTTNPTGNFMVPMKEAVALEVLEGLQEELPHAVIGWRDGWMPIYKRDPRGFAAAVRQG